ncbi:MAG: alpha/beta hydrolase [Pseudomonadota bacterium]
MRVKVLNLEVDGQDVGLSYMRRFGSKPPLVCLHGFGSTKEDYADLALRADFADRDLIFWDAPGCGASALDDPDALNIPFLAAVVGAACDAFGLARIHLSGHSMGGLTGLLFAQAHQDRVLSFIDIEGNLTPEDCFLSRQIVDHPAETSEGFQASFIERVKERPEYGSALYAAVLPLKVRSSSFKPIFSSMVDLSDNTDLMRMLEDLSCPKAFIYGEQNRHLSYLEDLPGIGVRVIEIPHSGHFPMYSNPPALWSAMAKFLDEVDG